MARPSPSPTSSGMPWPPPGCRTPTPRPARWRHTGRWTTTEWPSWPSVPATGAGGRPGAARPARRGGRRARLGARRPARGAGSGRSRRAAAGARPLPHAAAAHGAGRSAGRAPRGVPRAAVRPRPGRRGLGGDQRRRVRRPPRAGPTDPRGPASADGAAVVRPGRPHPPRGHRPWPGCSRDRRLPLDQGRRRGRAGPRPRGSRSQTRGHWAGPRPRGSRSETRGHRAGRRPRGSRSQTPGRRAGPRPRGSRSETRGRGGLRPRGAPGIPGPWAGRAADPARPRPPGGARAGQGPPLRRRRQRAGAARRMPGSGSSTPGSTSCMRCPWADRPGCPASARPLVDRCPRQVRTRPAAASPRGGRPARMGA